MFEPAILTNIILGVVQGLTEFLPVSSSGHLVLAHTLLGSLGELDLSLDALLHFATAAAIVVYFRKTIWSLVREAFRLPFILSRGEELNPQSHMVLALILGTIPAVIFGLLLEDIMSTLFRNPLLVAGALVVGSMLMFLAEKFQGIGLFIVQNPISWRGGIIIGLFQSLALIPGMSRSGMTISSGMLIGMNRTEAATFGFLLGVPILLGAGAKKAFELGLGQIDFSILVGTITSFLVALFVIHFLLKFLQRNTLYIFIWYRLILAVAVILFSLS